MIDQPATTAGLTYRAGLRIPRLQALLERPTLLFHARLQLHAGQQRQRRLLARFGLWTLGLGRRGQGCASAGHFISCVCMNVRAYHRPSVTGGGCLIALEWWLPGSRGGSKQALACASMIDPCVSAVILCVRVVPASQWGMKVAVYRVADQQQSHSHSPTAWRWPGNALLWLLVSEARFACVDFECPQQSLLEQLTNRPIPQHTHRSQAGLASESRRLTARRSGLS